MSGAGQGAHTDDVMGGEVVCVDMAQQGVTLSATCDHHQGLRLGQVQERLHHGRQCVGQLLQSLSVQPGAGKHVAENTE